MASQYNVEPQPTAKVVLNTTSGDLTLELFAKQVPLASRNFLQHCLDGYYNNTLFHRLVPGFILQGGDPTGTGAGGISAVNDGEPFEDEFHSRLKFNRRGLIGMANEGKDNNTSQFFFTLAPTPELQGKNTMFGRIEDDTVFNLMKMAEAELADGSERPLYPVRITGSEIVLNPFADMVARVKAAPRGQSDDKVVKKRKRPMGKNKMSFEDDGDVVMPVIKKSKVNQKLVTVVETPEQPKPKALPVQRLPTPEPVRAPLPERQRSETIEIEDDEDEEQVRDAKRQTALDKMNAEIAAMKASMRRGGEKVEQVKEKPTTALEAMIPTTSRRGRKKGTVQDEPGALEQFNAFRSKLEGVEVKETSQKPANTTLSATIEQQDDDEEAELCDLHFIANCQSCKAWDQEDGADDDNDDDPTSWMSHKLTFAKDTLGKDLEWRRKMDEFEVIDPLEKTKALKEERRNKR